MKLAPLALTRKELIVVALVVLGPVFAAHVLLYSIEAIRASKGVASDTCTIMDMVAWLFCSGCLAALITGCLRICYRLVRPTGVGIAVLCLGVIGWQALWGSAYLNAMVSAFNELSRLMVACVVVCGIGCALCIAGGSSVRWAVTNLIVLFVVSALSLWFVYAPLVEYFMKLYAYG